MFHTRLDATPVQKSDWYITLFAPKILSNAFTEAINASTTSYASVEEIKYAA